MQTAIRAVFVVLLATTWSRSSAAAPASVPLVTQWAAGLTPDNAWREYPRPQLTRPKWMSLNGQWEAALTASNDAQPAEFSERILVPFPVESFLGGWQAKVEPDQRVWYRRHFKIPPDWPKPRILLHFGAVDWDATVWVNGVRLGDHQGGYDPFFFDVTKALDPAGDNEVVVSVVDPTDAGTQPLGKQRRVPEGIRYTPTTGIWQTVWLEPTPESSIGSIRITPHASAKSVTIDIAGVNLDASYRVEAEAVQEGAVVARGETAAATPLTLSIPNARLWSPDHPFLYDLRIRLVKGSKVVDEVGSYFGLRSVALGRDKNGLTRIMLNGEPLFQFGLLDQGYWPDGLYTPPSDDAMKYDLETVKRLGFNMVRKHVKVESARWYYWCDRLGVLVWQDMPSGDEKAPWPRDGTEIVRSFTSAAEYRKELKAVMDFGYNFPCIVAWIPFNEGWGQFDTKQIAAWLKDNDPSRLVVSASGGNDFGAGDADDDHFYPGPGSPPAERGRAAVLGEFGGLGLGIAGHSWKDQENWGYRSYENREEFEIAYSDLIGKLRPLVESHVSAAVYTQLTDVESEVNGLMTYDRKLTKLDANKIASINGVLFNSLPKLSDERRLAAATLAWWRFEDGASGDATANIADNKGAIAAADSSGHNNHLFAFSDKTAPRFCAVAYEAKLSQGLQENRVCLDDTRLPADGVPVRDLFTDPNLARTHMDLLDTFPFSEWTVEASFSLAANGGSQAILTKQGRRPGLSNPPFQLGVFGDGDEIQLQLIDAAGQLRTVSCKAPAKVEAWQHVAATCDGRTLKLYVRRDEQRDYQLQDETSVEGAMVTSEGTWAVGRGYHDAQIAFDARALIDEVRISAVARTPDEFLFASRQTISPTGSH